VRSPSPSLAISLVVHVALVAVIATRDPDPPEPPAVAEPAATVIEVVPPIEVEVLRDEETTDRVDHDEAPAPSRVALRGAARTSQAFPSATKESVATKPGMRTPLLDMRKGRDLEGRGRNFLRPTERTLENALVPRDPVTPPSVEPTGLLEPAGGGRYRSEDLVTKTTIAKDGTVTFTDKSNIQHQFTSLENVKRVLREAGPFGLLRLDFDITDAFMRRHKIDPYASRKLKFLDATRDERVRIGARYKQEQLARTPELVQRNLERLWATETDLRARKQGLFELWDDAAETGSERMVAAGDAARRAVIGFIRGRLPADSADAFTAAELAACNARKQSRATFAPYD
jgi:hypothetical protein